MVNTKMMSFILPDYRLDKQKQTTLLNEEVDSLYKALKIKE